MDRRSYIHTVVRGGILGVLAFAGALLVSRRQVELESSCGENFACKSCRKLSRCKLPEAHEERKSF
jgi:hypothetical protein